MPNFTDVEIVRLFGYEDAENERPERLKEYFFRNRAYDNLVGGLPEVERLILGMRPTRKEKTTLESYMFTNDQLINKLKNLMQQNTFRFASGYPVTAKALAEFLYKVDLITARKENETAIVRRFFDESQHLQNQFVDFGFKWEIHPAYRWALQPGEPDSIFREVDLVTD